MFAAPKDNVPATDELIIKFEFVPLIIPFQEITPIPPRVIVLVVLDPRDVALSNNSVAVDKAGELNDPKVKSPPIFIPPVNLPVNVRFAVPAIVPPFIVREPPAPIALTPPAAIIPSFKVTPPANVEPVI